MILLYNLKDDIDIDYYNPLVLLYETKKVQSPCILLNFLIFLQHFFNNLQLQFNIKMRIWSRKKNLVLKTMKTFCLTPSLKSHIFTFPKLMHQKPKTT